MTEYEVRYLRDDHHPGGFTVIAKDVTHAITQFNELIDEGKVPPRVHITSVLPADQWTKDDSVSD